MQTKVLKAGTKKYLLIDEHRMLRNTERTKRGEAIVMVVEVIGDTLFLHRANGIAVTEAVQLEYSQHKPLALGRGINAHAAWVTTGEVTLELDEPAAPNAPTLEDQPVAPTRKSTTPKTPKE